MSITGDCEEAYSGLTPWFYQQSTPQADICGERKMRDHFRYEDSASEIDQIGRQVNDGREVFAQRL